MTHLLTSVYIAARKEYLRRI